MPEAPTANSLIAGAGNNSTPKAIQANPAMRGVAAPKGPAAAYASNGKAGDAAQHPQRTAADAELTDVPDGAASGEETTQDAEAAGATAASTIANITVKAAAGNGQPTAASGFLFAEDSSVAESPSQQPAANAEGSASPSGSRRPASANEQSKSATQSAGMPAAVASVVSTPLLNPIATAPAFQERQTGRPHIAAQSSANAEKTGTSLPFPPAAVEVRIRTGDEQNGAPANSSMPVPETNPATNSSTETAGSGASAQADASAGRESRAASHAAGDDNDTAKDDNTPGTQTALQSATPNAGQHVSTTFSGTHGAMSSTVTAASASSSAPVSGAPAAVPANTPGQTPQHALPPKADAAPTSAPSHAQELAEDGKTQPQQLRSVSLEFTPDGAQDVRVRLQERGGDVHISLHSTDPALSGRLRDGVEDLAGALSNAGYNADAWASGGGRQQQQQREAEQQRQPQRRNDQNAAGNEFSGMMQQTNQETS
jgi:hypothetical protein